MKKFAEEAERFHAAMVTLLRLSLGLGVPPPLPTEGGEVFTHAAVFLLSDRDLCRNAPL